MNKLAYAALFSTALAATVEAAIDFELVVESQTTVHKNNRPAHFNWSFESENGSDPQVGQFACGSYWVAPAEGDTGVRLLGLTGSGKSGQTDLLALDADPLLHDHGLLWQGDKRYGSNDKSQDDLPHLPKLYTPPAESCISLVACMQRNEEETSKAGTKGIEGGAVDAYCIVTIMAEVPPDEGRNSIRPNIVGDKKDLLTWDDFDLTRLPSHSFANSISNPEKMARRWNHSTEVFGMWTWDGTEYRKYSEGGRAFRAHLLHHNYAAGWMSAITSTLYALLGPDSVEDKKMVLASLLAHGQDTWHARYGREEFPGAWSSGAGQSGGQFNTPAFYAALLKDPSKGNRMKKTIVENFGSSEVKRGPQEMRQVVRGQTGVLLWGDDHRVRVPGSTKIPWDDVRYWAELHKGRCYTDAPGTCKAGVGQKTMADPYGYVDGPPGSAGTSYFSVSAGGVRAFAAMMLLFPEFRAIVNTDEPIEYADRVGRHGVWAFPDPIAAPQASDRSLSCSPWEGGEGCENYRDTWGPSSADGRFAIEDGVGRFAHRHGADARLGYTIGSIENDWPRIIALYDGPTFEDTFTPLGTCVAPDIYIYPEDDETYVFMRTGTQHATIHYTLDGTDPTAESPIFTTAFAIEDIDALQAVAVKEGLETSAVAGYKKPIIRKSLTPHQPSHLTTTSGK